MTTSMAAKARIARFLHRTMHSLGNELRQLHPWGPRAPLCAITVGSVVLAVLLADAFDLNNRWWVAISAYTVARGSLKVSLGRSLDRIAGTILGAALGVLVLRVLPHSQWLFALALASVTGLGLYNAIGSARSYAWILGTVTALLVISEAHALTGLSAFDIATRRASDVLVGITASMIVVAAAHLIRAAVRRLWPLTRAAQAPAAEPSPLDRNNPTMRTLRAMQAAQGAITVGLLGLFAYHRQLPAFPQTLISVAVVLLVPLPALLRNKGEDDLVNLRMVNRALGCMMAALFAVATLPVIGNTPWLCLVTLAMGVWLSAHIQAGSSATSYLGTQFGVGFIMTFVQDQRWSTDASAPAMRLLGILIGLALLAAVIFVTTRIRLLVISVSVTG